MKTTPPPRTVPRALPPHKPDDKPEDPDEEGEFTGVMSLGSALETLAHHVGAVETLAWAADRALGEIPHTTDERMSRALVRINVLVAALADAAIDAYSFANEAVGKFVRFNKRRRRTVEK